MKAYEYSSAVVIFCPIFTRFDYDVGAALYDARGKHREDTRAETICMFGAYNTARVTVFVCLPLSQVLEQNHFGGDASHFWQRIPFTAVPVHVVLLVDVL